MSRHGHRTYFFFNSVIFNFPTNIFSDLKRPLIGSSLASFDDAKIRTERSTVKLTRTRVTTTIFPIDTSLPKKSKIGELDQNSPPNVSQLLPPRTPREIKGNARECDILIVYMRDALCQATERDLVKRIDDLAKLLIINAFKQNQMPTPASKQQQQYQQSKKLTVLTTTMNDVSMHRGDNQAFVNILNASKVVCLCRTFFSAFLKPSFVILCFYF
jgi:hypothetical protein